MATGRAHLDAGSWPAALGGIANDWTAPVPLMGEMRVRWRIDLPHERVGAVRVAADGALVVSTEDGITALDGPVVRWSVHTDGPAYLWFLLDNGLFVSQETDNLVVREQRSGARVATIDASFTSQPTLLPNGLVAFVDGQHGSWALCAATLTGQRRWERPLQGWSAAPPVVRSDQVIVADGATLRSFNGEGTPGWTVALETATLPRISAVPVPAGAQPPAGEVGPLLMCLPSGRILASFEADDRHGYLVVDRAAGEVRALPAHLPIRGMVVPLRGEPHRELVVLHGWSQKDDFSQFYPTVTAVDVNTGTAILQHVVAAEPHSMVAGSTGMVAVAGGPSWERWTKYKWAQDFYPIRDWYYVLLLDSAGVRGEWRPGEPITGSLAVGLDGDLLVPLQGALVSLGRLAVD